MKHLPVVLGGSNTCKFHCNVQRFPLYTGIVWIGNVAGHVVTLETKKTRNRKHRKRCFRDLQGNLFWHEKGREISMESRGYNANSYQPNLYAFLVEIELQRIVNM